MKRILSLEDPEGERERWDLAVMTVGIFLTPSWACHLMKFVMGATKGGLGDLLERIKAVAEVKVLVDNREVCDGD